jgi:hypothetical protein
MFPSQYWNSRGQYSYSRNRLASNAASLRQKWDEVMPSVIHGIRNDDHGSTSSIFRGFPHGHVQVAEPLRTLGSFKGESTGNGEEILEGIFF